MRTNYTNRGMADTPQLNRRKALGGLSLLALGLVPFQVKAAPASKLRLHRECLYFDSLSAALAYKKHSPGMVLKTLGYYQPGDGGAATYQVIVGNQETQKASPGQLQLSGGLIGRLLPPKQINYALFGAKGDGQQDDGPAILQAHQYAVAHGLPIENRNGKYKVESTRGIPVQTSVDWGQSAFYVNEAFNTKAPLFHVRSYQETLHPKFSAKEKKGIVDRLKPGVQVIPELKAYRNTLVVVQDEQERIGRRAGARYDGQDRAKQELFYVEEDGRILGDIAWTFRDFTTMDIIPAEDSYLVVQGGSFYLSGDNHPEREKKGYFQNGISVTRSRTIIRNQWVGLQKGRSDTAYNPRNGFYNFNRVFDVLLENIRLIPWEQDRPGEDMDLYAGTYGIGGNRMLKVTFRNITAEGTLLHWGVFGTNMNKDFRIENCQLNRVDVHFHCWNLHILNSRIGQRGITLTGGGELCIENTTCYHQNLVSFRYDYGAKWEGNIYVRNCRLKPSKSVEVCLLRFFAADVDYGYPIGPALSIQVEDVILDYSSIPECREPAWLMRVSKYARAKNGQSQFFPTRLRFERIGVTGRTQGWGLLQLPDPAGYQLSRNGSAVEGVLETNAHMSFIDIDTEALPAGQVHFQMDTSTSDYLPESLYPSLEFKRCKGLALTLGRNPAAVQMEHCSIRQFHAGTDDKMPGEISFQHCKFMPLIEDSGKSPYQLDALMGTHFLNCTFHMPRKDTSPAPEGLTRMGVFQVNAEIKYNHLNSRLGHDILAYLKRTGNPATPAFIRRLGLHQDYSAELN